MRRGTYVPLSKNTRNAARRQRGGWGNADDEGRLVLLLAGDTHGVAVVLAEVVEGLAFGHVQNFNLYLKFCTSNH